MKRCTVLSLLTVALLLMITALPGLTPVTAAQCGGTIRAGQTVSGSIPRAGVSCSYTYAGAANETVIIAMEATSRGLDPYLELKNRRGTLLASDDDSGGNGNSLITYRLPAADTYTIVARAYNDAGSGSFRLRLDSSTAGGDAIPITANTWVAGTIASKGQRIRYTFSGTSGDIVNIAMRATTPGLDPWLDLIDPRGTIVASDDDSLGGSNSLISRYRLLQTGQYIFVARAYNDASTGSFEVRLER